MAAAESLVEAAGWLGSAFSLYAALSRTMIPLRVAAIAANVFILAVAISRGAVPTIALHAVLLPVNCWRLWEMRRLIREIRAATQGAFDAAWLKPFMTGRRVPAGTTLFAKGDPATEALLIVAGQVRIPEAGATIGPGALFGEMALFAAERRRHASAVAATDLDLLTISYDEFERLYAQNPKFGFYLIRLMMQRLNDNAEHARRDRRDPPAA
jgi:hypothetical protein